LDAFSTWLVQHTSHGLWDWAGAVGGGVLGVFAILGGIVALKSFLASSQASSHAHMHQMFLRFLEARDALSERIGETPSTPAHPSKRPSSLREDLDFGGAALYYLEEVYAWSQVEMRLATNRWMYPLIGRQERQRRLDIINSWRATVTTQLLTNREDVLPSLTGYTSCYGVEFLEFAAERLHDPALSELAAASRQAVDRGEERPLGSREAEQRSAVRDLARTPALPTSTP
jgi:hypothetical protein